MLTSSGRCFRASVVVISWTSYGSGTGFSLILLMYVMYVAFLAQELGLYQLRVLMRVLSTAFALHVMSSRVSAGPVSRGLEPSRSRRETRRYSDARSTSAFCAAPGPPAAFGHLLAFG